MTPSGIVCSRGEAPLRYLAALQGRDGNQVGGEMNTCRSQLRGGSDQVGERPAGTSRCSLDGSRPSGRRGRPRLSLKRDFEAARLRETRELGCQL